MFLYINSNVRELLHPLGIVLLAAMAQAAESEGWRDESEGVEIRWQ